MTRIVSTFRRLAVAAVAAVGLAAGSAQAGCGTIWTFNMTDHWMWVTIYSLGHAFQYDWGWVAPHNGRAWHAGGAPTPMSYMCGSFYHVRAEVKPDTGPRQPGNPPNIFDTETEINPQLKNWLEMIESVVKMGLTCAEGEGVTCAVKWGLEKGFDMAAFGNESSGGIVCLTTHDNKNFGWVDNDSCGDPKAKPKPSSVKISMSLAGGTHFPVAPRQNRIYLLVDGVPPTAEVFRLGKWSTPTPKVVKIDNGQFQVIGHGKGVIVFTYGGKSASATFESP